MTQDIKFVITSTLRPPHDVHVAIIGNNWIVKIIGKIIGLRQLNCKYNSKI